MSTVHLIFRNNYDYLHGWWWFVQFSVPVSNNTKKTEK